MSTQFSSANHKGPILWLLAGAITFSIWFATDAKTHLTTALKVSETMSPQCHNRADALAAADNSRNGVSLTCNSDILSAGGAR